LTYFIVFKQVFVTIRYRDHPPGTSVGHYLVSIYVLPEQSAWHLEAFDKRFSDSMGPPS
jgi:Mg2+ and Co2+ transporter CorA